MAQPQSQPQNMMPPPPPYDPNWQLRQTQFYNSPAATGQYSQGQYSQGQFKHHRRSKPKTIKASSTHM